MKNSKLSRTEILNLYLSGCTYKEISEKFGCARSTIHYYCSHISRRNFITQEQIDEINRLYGLGYQIFEIVKITKISKSSVQKYLIDKKSKIPDTRIDKRIKLNKYCADIKQQSVDYLGGKCVKCGYNKCNKALDFHHIDQNLKDFQISGGTKSFNLLKTELDKCILVCKNCHSEIHDNIDKLKLIEYLKTSNLRTDKYIPNLVK